MGSTLGRVLTLHIFGGHSLCLCFKNSSRPPRVPNFILVCFRHDCVDRWTIAPTLAAPADDVVARELNSAGSFSTPVSTGEWVEVQDIAGPLNILQPAPNLDWLICRAFSIWVEFGCFACRILECLVLLSVALKTRCFC